jgi:hypothetical protein
MQLREVQCLVMPKGGIPGVPQGVLVQKKGLPKGGQAVLRVIKR